MLRDMINFSVLNKLSISLFSEVISKVLAFVLIIYIANKMPVEDFSIFTACLAILMLMSVSINLGNNGLLNIYIHTRDLIVAKNLFLTILLISILMTI